MMDCGLPLHGGHLVSNVLMLKVLRHVDVCFLRACSYEPGLLGSSPEWDELYLCSCDCFYPT